MAFPSCYLYLHPCSMHFVSFLSSVFFFHRLPSSLTVTIFLPFHRLLLHDSYPFTFLVSTVFTLYFYRHCFHFSVHSLFFMSSSTFSCFSSTSFSCFWNSFFLLVILQVACIFSTFDRLDHFCWNAFTFLFIDNFFSF